MGLNADSYWKCNKRKIRDYLNHEYEVIAVVSTERLYRKATIYLSKKVKILRYNKLENFVTTSLKKAPNKKRLPLRKKSTLGAGLP